jgi:LPXTG-motif cell wall-anchored protein
MAVAAVLFALLPAAAAAQSAGDEQYEDPLAGQQESEQPQPTATPAPAAPAPDADSAQAPAPAAAPAGPAPSAGAAQLPRTGEDPLLAALAGAFLLASGAALRLRLRAG